MTAIIVMIEILIMMSAEICLVDNIIIGDVLGKWEILQKAGKKQFQICLKRKINFNPTEDPADPVARSLIFYQVR